MIHEIYGGDAREMTLALLRSLNAASLVPKGGSVALKPNLVIAGTPESGSTTHPGVLAGCIEYFRENGVSDISVIEGSWVGDDTMRAMRRAGYDEVCRGTGVPFFDLKRDAVRSVRTAVGPIDVCRRALDCSLLVDLPVLKGHCQTVMTCALKNLKGCLPDREKRRFHAMGLTRPIAALAAALKPRLVVVDSICGDLDFEEGGNPVQTNRMFAGTDAVEADAYGAQLMGLPLSDVPYIGLCEDWGGGSAEIGGIVRLNEPRDCTDYPAPTGRAAGLSRGVHADQACSACFAALVRALYNTGVHRGDIHIGQGWRGKTIDGIGIGQCCRGASTYCPGCPPTAQQVSEFLQEV